MFRLTLHSPPMTFHSNERGNIIPRERTPGEAVDARGSTPDDHSSEVEREDPKASPRTPGADLSHEEDQSFDSFEFHGYRIREDGAVFNSKGHRLKHDIIINRNGRPYPKFCLYVNGIRERWFAHRLMAWVFMAMGEISLQEFKTMIVDHLDNDPMNYALWNLEILRGGHSENLLRRHREYKSEPAPF